MNIDTLKKKITLEYKNVTLRDAYTLPEEDYADTSYWFFYTVNVSRSILTIWINTYNKLP
jgi:hypothetical protein